MASIPFRFALLVSVFALSGALIGAPPARSVSSLSDLDLESAEARLTLEKTLQENQRLKEEAVLLQEKIAVSEASAARLSESVAIANAEAEVFRRQAGEKKLQLQALGPAAGTGSGRELESRLLEAVNNLRHSEEDRQKVTLALKGLSEAAGSYVRAANDPKVRLELEAQMRRSSELLTGSTTAAEAAGIPATLTDGMVISIKDELGLVVANIGLRQGVAVGMPFRIIRDDRIIGTVRVVDARDRIAGAVIQDLTSEKDKIKVGDRLRVAALK